MTYEYGIKFKRDDAADEFAWFEGEQLARDVLADDANSGWDFPLYPEAALVRRAVGTPEYI